jgi:beta-propeller repeat-containing protein
MWGGWLAVVAWIGILTGGTALGAPGQRRLERLGESELAFVENRGQQDARVAYYLPGPDTAVYFTSGGLTLAFVGRVAGKDVSRWAVKVDFVGANPVTPVAEELMPAIVSYFRGAGDRSVTGLRTYRRVVYRDLWPGIDLAYSGNERRLKYEFVVAPGADPSRIRLAYRGADDVTVDASGRLDTRTPVAEFRDDAPESYQMEGGTRVRVRSGFRVERAPGGTFTAGFDVGHYDPERALVIDPAMVVYAGFIGGGAMDAANGVAVDLGGAAYVVGTTFSSQATFPVTVGPDLTFNNVSDAYVAKIGPDGNGYVYAGFVGGPNSELGKAIAVDANGSAYIAGETNASTANFPVKLGPDMTANGATDCFVAKIDPFGTGLEYAGFFGGLSNDTCNGIAVDSSGAAYITGETQSAPPSLPVTVGPDLTYGGNGDAFVAKINPNGSGFVYVGLIGGALLDRGYAIAVDADGSAYVTGQTASDETTLPVVVGPDLTKGPFAINPFVAKVDPSGLSFIYLGYIDIGFVGSSHGFGIAVDAAHAAYVTGDFGTVKVDPSGTGLVWASANGGNDVDVDSTGAVYLAGATNGGLAATPDLDTTYGGLTDAFIEKLDPTGTSIVYAGYIGGAGTDQATGIAVDPAGCAHVVGNTSTNNGSFPVLVGPQIAYAGGTQDGFITRICDPSTGLTTTSSTTFPSTTSTSSTTTTTTTVVGPTTSTTTTVSTTTTISTTTRPSSTTTTRRMLTTTSSTTTTLPIDPFLCYRTRLKQPVSVELSDTFDTGSYQGSGAQLFCLPAQVGGGTVRDTVTDLTAIRIRGPHVRRKRVQVENQMAAFPLSVDTKRVDTLLVPSVSDPAIVPDPASGVDHYRCVRIAMNKGAATFPAGESLQVTDQLGSRTLNVRKPTKLCLATAEDGAPVKNPDFHLMCAKVRTRAPRRAKGVQIKTEFGAGVIDLAGETELCVPSAVRP